MAYTKNWRHKEGSRFDINDASMTLSSKGNPFSIASCIFFPPCRVASPTFSCASHVRRVTSYAALAMRQRRIIAIVGPTNYVCVCMCVRRGVTRSWVTCTTAQCYKIEEIRWISAREMSSLYSRCTAMTMRSPRSLSGSRRSTKLAVFAYSLFRLEFFLHSDWWMKEKLVVFFSYIFPGILFCMSFSYNCVRRRHVIRKRINLAARFFFNWGSL